MGGESAMGKHYGMLSKECTRCMQVDSYVYCLYIESTTFCLHKWLPGGMRILIASTRHYEKEAAGVHAKQRTSHSPVPRVLSALLSVFEYPVDLSRKDFGLMNTLLGEATLVGALVSGARTTA